MNENNKNNQVNSNSPIDKTKQKAVNEAGKIVATAAGGAVGRKIYDVASKTKLGQQAINNVASFNKMKNSISKPGQIVSNITRGSGLSQINNESNIEEQNVEDNYTQTNSFSNKIEQLKQIKKSSNDLMVKLTNLKSQKIAIIIVGVIALILIFILLLLFGESTDWNLIGDGISDYSEAEYLPGYCSNIILVKEDDDYDLDPVNSIDEVDLMEKWDKDNDGKAEALRWSYRTIDLDEYVKHVLQAEAIYVNDEKTFEVAAIMARTYAIEITNKSCYTFDNKNKRDVYRNPQKYSEDTNIDSYISTAVSTTAGIVITLDDVPYNMDNSSYYDLFCYREKRVLNEENDENNYYRLLQENSEEVLNIDATWANENIPESCGTSTGSCYNRSGKLNEGIFTDDCQANGVSLFAAKYLLNKEMDSYTTFRVMEYFLSYDIKFKKVPVYSSSSTTGGASCGQFDMTKTTLSRDEFIAKVNSFSSSYSDFSTLKQYAGEIYDMSISNNFNPELIYARAQVEGYSPGGSTYNYYGIGCPNGKKCSKSYNSVTEGALAFINVMKGYGVSTLFDVYNVKHYAYIGSSWVLGGPGTGGCYYFEHIKKYYKNISRVNTVESACNSGNAIPTNDEDQEAYSYFQIQKMLDARMAIFGIGAENCKDTDTITNANFNSGTCSLWAQGDPQWGAITLGNSGKSMSAIGCLTTSLAMSISCTNSQTNIANFNPGTFAQKLSSIGGYDGGGSLYWTTVSKIVPSFKHVNNKIEVSKMDTYLSGNYVVLAHLSTRNHWVYVYGKSSNGYSVKDPAGGIEKTMQASEFDKFSAYEIGG